MSGMTRRDFLLSAAGASTAAFVRHLLPESIVDQPMKITSAAWPTHRVVHMHSNDATSWDFATGWYGNYVNQSKVDEMVDRGVMALTNTASVAAAWQALLPAYTIGQKIAIKINLNNATCNDNDQVIDALPQPINAVIRGLKTIGVAEGDIWVYDVSHAWHTSEMPTRLVNKVTALYPAVQFHDAAGSCATALGYSAVEKIHFNVPAGKPATSDKPICNALVNATYLINMPIIKKHSAGVTLGFKNHFGSFDRCDLLHWATYLDDPAYTSTYSALVDVNSHPQIRNKTVLTLGDALFGDRIRNYSVPSPWVTFGNKAPNSLFFATDPVAIDCVMCDFLNAEGGIAAKSDDYLKLAAVAGLGLFERWDANHHYHAIDYQRIEADAQVATLNLAEGWNLLSLSLSPSAGYTAQSALAEIAAQGGNGLEIDRWWNGGWDAYIHGLPFNDFALMPGIGFFCKCTQASTWSLTGYPIQQASAIELTAGWNLIAIPYSAPSLTAADLLAAINVQGGTCTEIDRWWNGGWNAYVGGLPVNNFVIENGQGYFIKCSAPSTYVP